MADPKTYTEDEFNAMVAERDALKGNRDAALTEAKAAKKRLADYEGVDPLEYKTLKEAAAEAERKKALAEGNLETWKKQVTDAHQKEREADAKRVAKLTAALDKRKVAKLTDALAKADASPEFMELLTLKGSAAVRLRETDEDWEEYVGDERGNPLVADGNGSAMSIPQYVEKVLKVQYPGAFRGSGSSGGGAVKSSGGAGGTGGVINVTGRTVGADFMAAAADIASGKVLVNSQPIT